MMLYDKQSLKALIQGEVREHLDFKIRRENGMLSNCESYINQSEPSRRFYENFNAEELTNRYMQNINDIAYSCEQLTTKEKILYLLELMRISAMYENIGEKAAVLSQAGINVALLGKGVCSCQARYLTNLLLACNIEAKSIRIDIPDEGIHRSVLAKLTDDETIIIDPTWYDGSMKKIENFVNEAKDVKYEDLSELNISQLVVSESEIDIARKRAGNFILKYYGLNEILRSACYDNLSETDRFLYIIKFLQNNLVVSQEKENTRSVVLNNREFEIGKALELLLLSNNLLFNIVYKSNKANCFYSISISSKDFIIAPQNIFKKNSNQIGRKWLAIFDGESFTINEDCKKICDILDTPKNLNNQIGNTVFFDNNRTRK